MKSTDVKTHVKQQEIRNWWLHLILHVILVGIPSSLILSVKNRNNECLLVPVMYYVHNFL